MLALHHVSLYHSAPQSILGHIFSLGKCFFLYLEQDIADWCPVYLLSSNFHFLYTILISSAIAYFLFKGVHFFFSSFCFSLFIVRFFSILLFAFSSLQLRAINLRCVNMFVWKLEMHFVNYIATGIVCVWLCDCYAQHLYRIHLVNKHNVAKAMWFDVFVFLTRASMDEYNTAQM